MTQISFCLYIGIRLLTDQFVSSGEKLANTNCRVHGDDAYSIFNFSISLWSGLNIPRFSHQFSFVFSPDIFFLAVKPNHLHVSNLYFFSMLAPPRYKAPWIILKSYLNDSSSPNHLVQVSQQGTRTWEGCFLATSVYSREKKSCYWYTTWNSPRLG